MQHMTHITLDNVSLVPSCLPWVCPLLLWGAAELMPLACSHAWAPHASPAQPDFCPGMARIGLFQGNKPVLPCAMAPVWTLTGTSRNREQAPFLPALRCSPLKEHSASLGANEGNSSHPSQQDNPPGMTSFTARKGILLYVTLLYFETIFSFGFSLKENCRVSLHTSFPRRDRDNAS